MDNRELAVLSLILGKEAIILETLTMLNVPRRGMCNHRDSWYAIPVKRSSIGKFSLL
jgi:hypothetical protein